MNRKQRRNAKKLNAKVIKEVQEVTKEEAIKQATSAMLAATLLILHDDYGFGHKRCKDVLEKIEEEFISVSEGYLSLEDMKQTIKEELSIALV